MTVIILYRSIFFLLAGFPLFTADMNTCELQIGPLYSPTSNSNIASMRINYEIPMDVEVSYMERTRYEIFLTATDEFTESIVQAREDNSGEITGKFSFMPESVNKYFTLRSCNSSNDTFTSSGAISSIIIVNWTSLNSTPANNVTFYYSLYYQSGSPDTNIIGTTLLVLQTNSTHSFTPFLTSGYQIIFILLVILIFI